MSKPIRRIKIEQSTHSKERMVGLGRLELPTPRLSSVCSNQLSYRPDLDKLYISVTLANKRPEAAADITIKLTGDIAQA